MNAFRAMFASMRDSIPRTENARQKVHSEIRVKAGQDREGFRAFLERLNLDSEAGATDYSNAIEALADGHYSWEALLLLEMDRVLVFCEQSSSKWSVSAFSAFGFLEATGERTLDQARLKVCLRGMRSVRPRLRYACLELLGGFTVADTPPAREALQSALTDENWRVRAKAEWLLQHERLLPGDYGPSIFDRIRRKVLSPAWG